MHNPSSSTVTALLLTVTAGIFGCGGAEGDDSATVLSTAFQPADAGIASDDEAGPQLGAACLTDDDCAPGQTGMACWYLDCTREKGACAPADAACGDHAAPHSVCGCDGRRYENACEAASEGVVVDRDGSCVAQASPPAAQPPAPAEPAPPTEPSSPVGLPVPIELPALPTDLICTAVNAPEAAGLLGGILIDMILDPIADVPVVGGLLVGTARSVLDGLGLADAPLCQAVVTLRDFTGLPIIMDVVAGLRLPLGLFNLVGVDADALSIAAVADCCEP